MQRNDKLAKWQVVEMTVLQNCNAKKHGKLTKQQVDKTAT
jgi:hypothetical protein